MRLPAPSALLVALLTLVVSGCRCNERTMAVKPVISLEPTALDFGDAKVGRKAKLPLKVRAAANATLHVSMISISGDMAYAFESAPDSVPGLGEAQLDVTLTPTEVRAYAAELVIASDDEEHPEVRVALKGNGETPKIEVTPQCTPPCMATVSATAITFAPEPADRAIEPPVSLWPAVHVASVGKVPLDVASITVEGADAAAFSVLGMAVGTLAPAMSADVPVKFDPNAMQTRYSAELVIRSDDPARIEIRIPMTGELRANLPPIVCANITRVRPGDGSAPIDYTTEWGPAPDAGYDFTRTREVQPNSIVDLSAWSSADPLTCTTDPEDERIALTYLWEVVSAPPGPPPALTGATTANARFAAAATGTYTLRLTVQDVQLHASTAELRLLVAVKQDLVAQLSWTQDPAVDLDLHLVRPGSSPFSFFAEGDAGRTGGDLNGWAQLVRAADGGDFEWGDPGPFDDPRLNLDDTGQGSLLENASLNYPEHAAACAGSDCTYQVLVHYFRDARDAGAVSSCSVSGCRDGEQCDCAAGRRCVANVAPIGDAGLGPGTCHGAVRPVVRVFVRADPVPAAVIPLDSLLPADGFGLGSPCELWHVADVTWPRRGADAGTPVRVDAIGRDDAGYLTGASIQRYGYRPNASGQCAPNVTRGGRPWYAP